jgi:hypothetical protein
MQVRLDVVVAAHPLHARAQRAVRVEERLELGFAAGVGEVTLHDDGVGIERAHLVDHGPVHDLGVRTLAGLGAQDRAQLLLAQVADSSALHLAEVHVVGGRDRREQPARGTLERRERRREPFAANGAVDVELILGARLQADHVCVVIRARRRDLGVTDPRRDRVGAVGAEGDDRLVRSDGHELGVVRDRHGPARQARERRSIRPDSRHGPRRRPARRAVSRDARTQASRCSASPPVADAAARAAAWARSCWTTSMAAVIAASSSGEASGEMTRKTGPSGMRCA